MEHQQHQLQSSSSNQEEIKIQSMEMESEHNNNNNNNNININDNNNSNINSHHSSNSHSPIPTPLFPIASPVHPHERRYSQSKQKYDDNINNINSNNNNINNNHQFAKLANKNDMFTNYSNTRNANLSATNANLPVTDNINNINSSNNLSATNANLSDTNANNNNSNNNNNNTHYSGNNNNNNNNGNHHQFAKIANKSDMFSHYSNSYNNNYNNNNNNGNNNNNNNNHFHSNNNNNNNYHSNPNFSFPYQQQKLASPANLSSALKLVKTFNGDADKFAKWKHEIGMVFKSQGWAMQLLINYFEPINNKDRYSSIYIPSGESVSDRLHRETLEEENKLKLKTKLSLLTDQQRLDIDSGYALIWGTLGEKLSDLLLPPNSQEGNPFDLYTNICLKFQSLTLLDKNRLQSQLDDLKLGPSEDMESFFSRVSQLSNKLSTAGIPISIEQIRYKIYKALPIDYKQVIKTYQITSPDISIDELKIRLREEQAEMRDTSKRSNSGTTNTGSANAFTHIKSNNNNNNNKNNGSNNKSDNKKNKSSNKKSQSPSSSHKGKTTSFKPICFRCGGGHSVPDCPHPTVNKFTCSIPNCLKPINHHNNAAHTAAEKYNSSRDKSKGSAMVVMVSKSLDSAGSTGIGTGTAMSVSITADQPVLLSCTDDQETIKFVLDSGATYHAVKCLESLTDVRDTEPFNFKTACGSYCVSDKIGTLILLLDTGTVLTIPDVRYVPSIIVNLLSIDQLELRGTTISFVPDKGYALLTNKQGQKLKVPSINHLRILYGTPITDSDFKSSKYGVAFSVGQEIVSYDADTYVASMLGTGGVTIKSVEKEIIPYDEDSYLASFLGSPTTTATTSTSILEKDTEPYDETAYLASFLGPSTSSTSISKINVGIIPKKINVGIIPTKIISKINVGIASNTVTNDTSTALLAAATDSTGTATALTTANLATSSLSVTVSTIPSCGYFSVNKWGEMSESDRIKELIGININDADRVQVRDSKQAGGGKGLFALKVFPGPKISEKSGPYIIQYIGTPLTDEQAANLKPHEKGYVARYSNHTYIDATDTATSNVARFANRGTVLSSSNARLVSWGGALWVHPLTTINVGDEILICYNRGHDIDGTVASKINPVAAYSIENVSLSVVSTNKTLLSDHDLWHYRLGHLAKSGLETLIKSKCVHNLDINITSSGVSLSNCPSCLIAKAKRLPYADVKTDSVSATMDEWDMDLCGPISSSFGSHYMLLIIDVFSRYTFIKIIKTKDEAEQEIIDLITLQQNQIGKKLRRLHSDGGGEFKTIVLDTFCAEHGILRTTTTRNTPQHNSKVERANGTIISNTRACLLHGNVPDGFWTYGATNAVFIRNRVTTKGINIGKSITDYNTPFQLWFGRRPDLKHLRVLFCDCFYINETKIPGKLTSPGVAAIYVGYNEIKSGYDCYDIGTDKVITTRHVSFLENSFKHSAKLKLNVDSSAYDYTNQSEQDLFTSQLDQNELELVKQISLLDNNSTVSSSSSISNPIIHSDSSSSIANGDNSGPVSNTKESQNNNNNNIPIPIPSSSPIAQTKTKVKFDSVNSNNIIANGSSRRRNTVWRLGMVDYEKDVSAHSFFSDEDEIECQNFLLSAHVSASDLPDPKNYKEAMASPDAEYWKVAMLKEFTSLTENGTWKLVVLPTGAHIMGCRWVFKKKIDSNGNITYKARLCAQGFSQKEDEYGETYAPVLGYPSLRILLSLATKLNYDLNQMDVCTAFLNADVQETIYMKQPEGYVTSDGKVCRLIKTLYGLKQAPCEWNKLLNAFLIEHGWLRCVSDPCIYRKISKTNQIMFIGVFVDDSISGYSPLDLSEFNQFKTLFMKRFKSVDLGEVKQILGMLVIRDRKAGTLFLHQKPYVLKLLKTFKMEKCKIATTPEALSLSKLLPKERIPIKTDADFEKHRSKMSESPYSQYLAIVGSVIYLMISTRPDIAHAVHILSRYMSNYTELHFKCAKHLLRYLAGTTDYGLLYTSTGGTFTTGGTSHISYVPRPSKPMFDGKVKTTPSSSSFSKINGMDKHIVDLFDVKHAIDRSDGSIAQTSKLLYSASDSHQSVSSITAFGMSDANYGGDRESLHGNILVDYKSTTGALVYIKNNDDNDILKGDLIGWKSTKQPRIAQSSCESEYMAAVKCANFLVWISALLDELSFKQLSPSILHVDNQAAIALSKNVYTGDQSRHIAIPFHVIKEYTQHLQIDTQWIDTKSQYADILTKCLSADIFIPLRDKLVSKLH